MVVGKFERLVSAQHAVADLVTSGYPRSSISVLVRSAMDNKDAQDLLEGGALARATDVAARGSVLAGGPLGTAIRACAEQRTEDAVAQTLAGAGLRPTAALFFADAVFHGAILVAVHCPDPYIRDARDILDTYADDDDVARAVLISH